MSARHTAAMRRRWADPAYRARQTEANRRLAVALRTMFAADPLRRKQHGLAIKIAKRKRP